MKQIHTYILVIGAVAVAFGIGIVTSGGFNFGQLQLAGEKTNFGVKQAFAAGTQEAFDYLSTTKFSTSSFCGLQP